MNKNQEKLIIGDDNICPVTKKPCDDECCPPGSECNISGDGLGVSGELAPTPVSEPKTAIQVLNKYAGDFASVKVDGKIVPSYLHDDVLAAMKAYASQQTALLKEENERMRMALTRIANMKMQQCWSPTVNELQEIASNALKEKQ